METYSLSPIGVLRCDVKYRYETPRQGSLALTSTGIIQLLPQQNFEQALKDLDQFERIWLLFVFHHNTNWKPLVNVPRHRSDKVGLFATRAPYRPNPIGITAAKLDQVKGLSVYVSEIDLLDGTPILDIKPYLPYADSFPDSKTGWARDACANLYAIALTQEAQQQTDWLKRMYGINLEGFLHVQLQHAPDNSARKRITQQDATHFTLSYRTWRIHYQVDFDSRTVTIIGIASGYSPPDLATEVDDPYNDKNAHREYLNTFPSFPSFY